MDSNDFLGAHVALFLGDRLLVILRDDFAHIPSPNCWDFPGGTREANETPIETLQRETREEVGLDLPSSAICYAKHYQSVTYPDRMNWFYVAKLDAADSAQVVLGDEGQRWALMTPNEFLAQPNVVQSFVPRLTAWLELQ